MENIDVYYIVDAEKGSIDRVQLSRSGVISIRAGVSLLREEQLGQLAVLMGTDLETVTATLQNPPEPFRYSDTTPKGSEMIGYYNPTPEVE